MDETSSLYYSHSGRAPLKGVAIAVACGAVASSILAVIYAYFDAVMPFIYLNMLAVMVVGWVAGLVTGLLLVRQRIRNNSIAAIAGAFVGLIALYVAWAAWPDAIIGERAGIDFKFAHLLTSPSALFRAIGWINKHGAWRLGSTVQTGFVLWVAWASEAALLIGFSTLLAKSFITGRVFCESCNNWCTKEKKVLEAHGFASDELRERLEAKDFGYLSKLGPRTRNDVEWIRLELDCCTKCGATTTLTAKRVDTTRAEGRELPKPIVGNLLLSRSEVEQLRDFRFR